MQSTSSTIPPCSTKSTVQQIHPIQLLWQKQLAKPTDLYGTSASTTNTNNTTSTNTTQYITNTTNKL